MAETTHNQNLLRWSLKHIDIEYLLNEHKLEFTPLEFETRLKYQFLKQDKGLEFTPLEFETWLNVCFKMQQMIRIYSVGV